MAFTPDKLNSQVLTQTLKSIPQLSARREVRLSEVRLKLAWNGMACEIHSTLLPSSLLFNSSSRAVFESILATQVQMTWKMHRYSECYPHIA